MLTKRQACEEYMELTIQLWSYQESSFQGTEGVGNIDL